MKTAQFRIDGDREDAENKLRKAGWHKYVVDVTRHRGTTGNGAGYTEFCRVMLSLPDWWPLLPNGVPEENAVKPLPEGWKSAQPVPDGWPDDWQVQRCVNDPNVTIIQSSYGPHDEQLLLNGNFSNDCIEREAYALEIAKVLNEHFSKIRPNNPRILPVKLV